MRHVTRNLLRPSLAEDDILVMIWSLCVNNHILSSLFLKYICTNFTPAFLKYLFLVVQRKFFFKSS
jgi:hypothetical protein